MNGYDGAYVANVTDLPFPDSSFDYVVSLDVLGHISLEDKDRVLAEVKRVMRPGGVTMHGIESIDRDKDPGYEAMDEEELRRFVRIDGHIGLEDDTEIYERFSRFFRYVQVEPRYTVSISRDEFLKQADEYGAPFEEDFLDYLRSLSFTERRAFDIAMGYVFGRISDLNLKLPKSGLYTLLKASETPLGPFYNEHRDRRDLLGAGTETDSTCLDRSAAFDAGWLGVNNLPPVARWMGERAAIRFVAPKLTKMRLDITTHMPELAVRPLGLQFLLNGQRLCALSLFHYGWLEIEIDVPQSVRSAATDSFEFEIYADRTWQPSALGDQSKDDRYLSIAVCNIEIFD
jgi:SAM-dependent methyltransferase